MAKLTDDFEWPPKADEVAIFEIGPDPWQKLQDASRDAFLARQRERSQPQQPQQPQRTPQTRHTQPTRTAEPAPAPTRKVAHVVIALAIIAAAGWAIQAATAPTVPVQAFHHPAPAAAAAPPPPQITVVATYPVEPDVASETRDPVAPVAIDPAPTDTVAPEEHDGEATPVDQTAEPETPAAPAGTAPPGA